MTSFSAKMGVVAAVSGDFAAPVSWGSFDGGSVAVFVATGAVGSTVLTAVVAGSEVALAIGFLGGPASAAWGADWLWLPTLLGFGVRTLFRRRDDLGWVSTGFS